MAEFARVEREVTRLRQELESGHLAEAAFKARLRELMVQDAAGDWWMMGHETGRWYRHDGIDWIRDDPPHRVELQPGLKRDEPSRTKRVVIWVLGAILSVVIGWGVGFVIVEGLAGTALGYGERNILGFIAWGLVAVVILVLTARQARKF